MKPISLAALVSLSLLTGCSPDGGASNEPASGGPGAGGTSAPVLTPVKLVLNWYPEMEHGGYYSALVHGYYQEAGLDVTIVPGGPNAPVIPQIDTGDATFGVENADRVLMFRARGSDVVAVMAPLQTSPRCLIVHEDSPVKSFEDLKNVTLAMSAAPWAEFLKKKLPLEGVEIVSDPGGLALFLDDPNRVRQAYVFSEPFLVEKQGKKVRSLMVSDLGFNPYTSLLVTQQETVARQPDLARKFVEASVRGWKKYLEDPAETHQKIHELNPEMAPDVLEKGYEAMKPLVRGDAADGSVLGRMTLERWKTLAIQLREAGVFKPEETVEPEKAFTTEFLAK